MGTLGKGRGKAESSKRERKEKEIPYWVGESRKRHRGHPKRSQVHPKRSQVRPKKESGTTQKRTLTKIPKRRLTKISKRRLTKISKRKACPVAGFSKRNAQYVSKSAPQSRKTLCPIKPLPLQKNTLLPQHLAQIFSFFFVGLSTLLLAVYIHIKGEFTPEIFKY